MAFVLFPAKGRLDLCLLAHIMSGVLFRRTLRALITTWVALRHTVQGRDAISETWRV